MASITTANVNVSALSVDSKLPEIDKSVVVLVPDDGAKLSNEIHDAVCAATSTFENVPDEFFEAMKWAIAMINNNKVPASLPCFVNAARLQKNFGLWLQVALVAIKLHVKKCRITWSLATGRSADAYKTLAKSRALRTRNRATANLRGCNTLEYGENAAYGEIIGGDVQLNVPCKKPKLQAVVAAALTDEDAKMGNEIHDAVREATSSFKNVPAQFWQTMDWAIDMANNVKPLGSFPSFVTVARSKNSPNFGLWLQVALDAIKEHVKKCRVTWSLATGRSTNAYKTLAKSQARAKFDL